MVKPSTRPNACSEQGCIYLGVRCKDGKYRCEAHRVRWMYATGVKEASGGFVQPSRFKNVTVDLGRGTGSVVEL